MKQSILNIKINVNSRTKRFIQPLKPLAKTQRQNRSTVLALFRKACPIYKHVRAELRPFHLYETCLLYQAPFHTAFRDSRVPF